MARLKTEFEIIESNEYVYFSFGLPEKSNAGLRITHHKDEAEEYYSFDMFLFCHFPWKTGGTCSDEKNLMARLNYLMSEVRRFTGTKWKVPDFSTWEWFEKEENALMDACCKESIK